MKKITLNEIGLIVSLLFALVTGILFAVLQNFYSGFRLLMLFVYVALVFVPYILKLFKLSFPKYINILYWIFLAISTLLGTIYDMYDIIPYYDVVIHAISGVLLAGFAQYYIEKKEGNKDLKLFTKFLFMLGFAVIVGILWECWEFVSDGVFSLNSQRYANESGVDFVGRNALMNTMFDLIADFVGGLIYATIYVIVKRNKTNLM